MFWRLIWAPELPAVLMSIVPKPNCFPQKDWLYYVFWILPRATLSMFVLRIPFLT